MIKREIYMNRIRPFMGTDLIKDMSRNGIKHRNIRDFLLAEEWN